MKFRPDLDGSAFRASLGIGPEAIVIASLGFTLRRKLETLLQALERLDAQGDVHCVIGGVGEDSAFVKSRARSIRTLKVHTPGFIAEKDLPAFYAASDTLVVSPNSLLECMGQSMKEAMACGIPIVGARIGGIPEAIRDGEAGLLYEPGNPQALSDALQRMVTNSEMRREMGVAGRRIASQRFDAAVSASQTLSVFREARAEIDARHR
jgi:phosphatidylinositol alpha-1,6-mannosyltransferase